LKFNKILSPNNSKFSLSKKLYRSLLLETSNDTKSNYNKSDKLVLIKFFEHPFVRLTKSIGLYAITEDYFEQDVNSVFCKNGEFIENGETIGLLNIEKEITGDIVQGLPRIEEILEARKKKYNYKKNSNK